MGELDPRGLEHGLGHQQTPHWSKYQGSRLPPSPPEAKKQRFKVRVVASFLGKALILQ